MFLLFFWGGRPTFAYSSELFLIEIKLLLPLLQVTRKQCYELYRQKWQTQSDNKKLKYINKAIEAKERYDVSAVLSSAYFHK